MVYNKTSRFGEGLSVVQLYAVLCHTRTLRFQVAALPLEGGCHLSDMQWWGWKVDTVKDSVAQCINGWQLPKIENHVSGMCKTQTWAIKAHLR